MTASTARDSDTTADVDPSSAEEQEPRLGVIATIAAVVGSLNVLGILVLVVSDVTLRFAANSPIRGANEISAYWLMGPLVAFGVVVAQRRGEHIDAPLITRWLSARGRVVFDLIALGLFLVLAVMFLVAGSTSAIARTAQGETAVASTIPIGLTRWFLPVAMAMLCVELVRQIVLVIVTARHARADASPQRDQRWLVDVFLFALLVVSQIAGTVLLFQPIPPTAKGIVVVAMMLVLIASKVPVAVAMAIPGLIGTWGMSNYAAFEYSLRDAFFTTSASWALSVLPMFILMGLLLWRSGATSRLYEVMRIWFSWLPGGLAVTTVATGGALATASGSTVGITYAVGRIGLPEMLKSGYDKRLATGSVLSSGLAGQLIPPSILLVVYAGVAEVPVGPQLLAGIVPGTGLFLSLCIFIIAIASFRPRLAPRGRPADLVTERGERLKLTLMALPVPALVVVVIGGMLSGIFTATEAGAFGALGALIITVLMVRKPREIARVMSMSLVGTVSSVGQIMFLLVGTAFLARAIALSGIPVAFVESVAALGLDRATFLVILVIAFLILGMFLEPIPVILLTVPFLLPVLSAMGIDLIWFGVFVVLLAELAMLTPPVGLLNFLVYKIARDPAIRRHADITLPDVNKSAFSFFVPPLVVVAALIVFITLLPATA